MGRDLVTAAGRNFFAGEYDWYVRYSNTFDHVLFNPQ